MNVLKFLDSCLSVNYDELINVRFLGDNRYYEIPYRLLIIRYKDCNVINWFYDNDELNMVIK